MELTTKHFTELTPDELYETLKIRSEIFVVEQQCQYNDLDEKDKNAYHVYLKQDNTIIAYLRVLNTGVSFEDAASIGRVLTIKNKRGMGYGNIIMQKGIEIAKASFGADKLRIEAQVHAKIFYEKLGFIICSEEFLEDGIPHVEMLLNL